MMEPADAPPVQLKKLVRVRYAYDNSGKADLWALHYLFRICKLRILKGVEKLDSRRLHKQHVYFQ
jgi:hypothetical protein